MSGNRIGAEGAKPLAEALRVTTELNLRFNNIQDEGISAICEREARPQDRQTAGRLHIGYGLSDQTLVSLGHFIPNLPHTPLARRHFRRVRHISRRSLAACLLPSLAACLLPALALLRAWRSPCCHPALPHLVPPPLAPPPPAVFTHHHVATVPHPCVAPSHSLQHNRLDDDAKQLLTDANNKRTTPAILEL